MKSLLLSRARGRIAAAALIVTVSGCATFSDSLPENTDKRDSNADNVFESSINYGKYCPGSPGQNGYQCFRYGVIEDFESQVQFFHPCYNAKLPGEKPKTFSTNPTAGSVTFANNRPKDLNHSFLRREVVMDLQCRQIGQWESRTAPVERVNKISVVCKTCADDRCTDYSMRACSSEEVRIGDADIKLASILKSRRENNGFHSRQAVAMATAGFRLNKQYCSEFSRELGRRQRYRAEATARLGFGNIVISSFLALTGAAPAAVGLSSVGFQAGQSYIQEFDSIYSFGGETGRIFEVAAKAMDEIADSTLPNITSYGSAVAALQRHSQVCSNAGIARLLNYSVKRVADGDALLGTALPSTTLHGLPLNVQQLLGEVLHGKLPIDVVGAQLKKLPETARKDIQQKLGVAQDGDIGNKTVEALQGLRESRPVATPLADLFP